MKIRFKKTKFKTKDCGHYMYKMLLWKDEKEKLHDIENLIDIECTTFFVDNLYSTNLDLNRKQLIKHINKYENKNK